ncbi:glycosyltransferase [Actinoplanes derwentensis]|uniref:Glycosyl transferase family 2 n=1 Tax=Actinoplanes derwentensis TaxID=113562 RepID=A0A1H1Y3M5_9ACTN|nr:glycosyltransferase family 2 protein [Actinoplanes derwentensis]GID86738.1 glycosyl transferase [Actinoplanes derwentensis]SDT15982.1 Glycosyl transferase family 2 [Actinoplanes derwentensis]
MLISIVVPVHNEQDFLRECLDAIFGQDEPVHEVIVVDNGSDDGTLRELAGHPGRVILLHEPVPGVQHARNRGLDAATGDVIGRIDADTRLAPGWSRAVRETFADPVVQAATGPVGYYDITMAGLVDGGDALFRRLSGGDSLDWLLGANMAIRATAWRRVKPALCTDADVHEDIDLGIHLHQEGSKTVFAAGLRAGTSARRIANRFGDYRAYALMTEQTYQRHRYAYARAWIVTRIQLTLFPVLRLAYAFAHPRPWTALRGDGGRANAMRPDRSTSAR